MIQRKKIVMYVTNYCAPSCVSISFVFGCTPAAVQKCGVPNFDKSFKTNSGPPCDEGWLN